ncbi:hypothetical protein CCM_07744 [Cordyceps militaris CM01]|uniref:Uncharacterized protein n=1 Tax=Cordyceps militaris (strain CM01) TaxID=983644 RepID=G3JQI8_CORMM|nr:uncharacterized protein CCM_07744 [Cordyceps militaris CM01]EGX89492.1 hypothetical protein CCM_07744 [Cordyceps militaris CM01]
MVTTRRTVVCSAARSFAGISELLWMVGELLVGDQSSLAKLCLVSRGFYQVFWSLLYRVVLLRERPSRFATDGDSASALAMFKRFANTKELHIQFSRKRLGRSTRMPVFHDFVASLLQHMNNVEVIRQVAHVRLGAWLTRSRLHGVTIAHSCINHLASNLNLKDLHVDFFDSHLRQKPPHLPQFMPYRLETLNPTSPFNSLRTLSFEGLDYHGAALISRYLASVFAQTPNLEHLRLSVLTRRCTDLLMNICNEYRTLGGGPLRLKSFFLGRFMHMIAEDMFSCLVDASILERAQIGADCECGNRAAAASLSLFTPTKTPKMQQLEIHEVDRASWSHVVRAVAGMKALKVRRLNGFAISLSDIAHSAKLTVEATVCGPESNGAWCCCLPGVCEALPNLPNLTAFHFAPPGGARWSNCHGKKETRNAAVALMESCTKLEYIELYGIAYEARWREADSESPENTWMLLSEAEKQIRQPNSWQGLRRVVRLFGSGEMRLVLAGRGLVKGTLRGQREGYLHGTLQTGAP